jgi:RND family efflux transporter MFP subunit
MKRVILIGLTVLGLAACSKPETFIGESEPKMVKVFTVDRDGKTVLRTFPGVVEPVKNAVMTFKVSGTLSEFSLTSGAMVEKGEIIAQLEDKDFKIQLARAESNYDLANSQLARMRKLHDKNTVSDIQMEKALAEQKAADADYQIAQRNLEHTKLIAPFDAIVAEVHVERYEQIAPTQAILTLNDVSSYNVSVQVPQNLMANAKESVVDYRPRVRFDAQPDKSYEASLSEWITNKDSSSDTYKVLYSLVAPTDITLLPGMTASIEVDLNEIVSLENSPTYIPVSAIFSSGKSQAGSGSVWLLSQENSLVKRHVTLGSIVGEKIEVISGLNEGDKIVSAGVNNLSEGTLVKEWKMERGL